MKGPVSIFPANGAAAWFWCGLTLVIIGFIVIQPYLLISSYKKNERVVVMDERRVFHVAPVLGLEDAKELYEYISVQAATAFMNRNPHGYDNQVLFRQIFLPEARQQAELYFKKDYDQLRFRQNNVHLKAEIAKVRILETAPGKVLSQVIGQALSMSKAAGRDEVKTFDYKLDFQLVRNPYLSKNGRLPYVVACLSYQKRK
jgi:hypothetical protein